MELTQNNLQAQNRIYNMTVYPISLKLIFNEWCFQNIQIIFEFEI